MIHVTLVLASIIWVGVSIKTQLHTYGSSGGSLGGVGYRGENLAGVLYGCDQGARYVHTKLESWAIAPRRIHNST